jgi:ABC-type nickel/cobalt efflux system permease component RcnA
MMGAGVGFSVSLIAIGSQYFRNRLERMVKDSTNSQHAPKLLLYMRSLGGILLFLIGWGLLKAASLINSAHPLL